MELWQLANDQIWYIFKYSDRLAIWSDVIRFTIIQKIQLKLETQFTWDAAIRIIIDNDAALSTSSAKSPASMNVFDSWQPKASFEAMDMIVCARVLCEFVLVC